LRTGHRQNYKLNYNTLARILVMQMIHMELIQKDIIYTEKIFGMELPEHYAR
jgi:hypothetical protein